MASNGSGSTKRTRQHHVPAAYLGRFSWDETKRARERPLWVQRRSGAPHVSRASRVATEIGLYDVSDDSLGAGGTADVAWGYESGLPAALDALAAPDMPLDGLLWASILVPFVAGLFVRGQEFQREFEQRFPGHVAELVSSDKATGARILEFQLLLAPVMSARWIVLHFAPEANFVTSDTAFAVADTPVGISYVVPVDKRTLLVITPSTRREILSWVDGQWLARIEQVSVADSDIPILMRAIGGCARDAVYGPSRDSVQQASLDFGVAPKVGPGLLGDLDLGCHMYDYFRVLSAVRSDPHDAQTAADTIDWSGIDEEIWTAPVAVEVLFPDRTVGGVREHGGHLIVDLEYGIEIRKARRAAGDFRMGATTLLELPLVRQNAARIFGRHDSDATAESSEA